MLTASALVIARRDRRLRPLALRPARAWRAGRTPAPSNQRVSERLAALEREASSLAEPVAHADRRDPQAGSRTRPPRRSRRGRPKTPASAARQELAEVRRKLEALETQRTEGLPALQAAVRRSLQARPARRAGAAAQRQRPARVRAGQPRGRGAGVPPPARHRRLRAHARRPARRARGADRQEPRAARPGGARGDGATRPPSGRSRRGPRCSTTSTPAAISTAQYLGELQQAYDRLGADMTARVSDAGWSSRCRFRSGRSAARSIGRSPGRLAGGSGSRAPPRAAVRNGIEVASAINTPGARRARRHGGLRRGLHRARARWSSSTTARTPIPFTAIWPRRSSNGETLVRAGAEVGRVGLAPVGGQPTLYFELRVDGRLVDPVQWLKPR